MTGKFIKFMIYLVLALLGLALLLFKPTGYTIYQSSDYYTRTLDMLDSMAAQQSFARGDTMMAGWSRQNITPEEPVSLMGYGLKGKYEQVHDSLYVRVVVFSDGTRQVALVSYDLMMVHPALAQAVRQAVDTTLADHLYFTAVHTHNGYGEWASGLAGRVIAGGYNPSVVDMISRKTRQAVLEAGQKLAPATIGYTQYAFPSLLHNRLVADGNTDPMLRVATLHKATGETGVVCTFAAHATYINSSSKDLSADYPGALVKYLEADTTIDFALFAAGGVGSHSPAKSRIFSYDSLQAYASQLSAPVLARRDSLHASYSTQLKYAALPVSLPEPQLKINRYWQIRPWVFRAFFGQLQANINLLQVGNIAFVGYPGDFSGMLYPQLNIPHGMHVMVTSFNGGYIGYIIPDAYYHEKDPEAQEMNWFGPYLGSYFVELTNRLLNLGL